CPRSWRDAGTPRPPGLQALRWRIGFSRRHEGTTRRFRIRVAWRLVAGSKGGLHTSHPAFPSFISLSPFRCPPSTLSWARSVLGSACPTSSLYSHCSLTAFPFVRPH